MTAEKYAVRKNYLDRELAGIEVELDDLRHDYDIRAMQLKEVWLANRLARITRRRKRIEAQLVKLQSTKVKSRRVH
jgi:hypothetical protein